MTAFTAETKPPKRIKKKKSAEEEPPAEAANGESDNVLPTAPLSKRQKKKQKKLLTLVKSKDKEVEKTIAYLSKWDSDRDEWKYEKLRQIFLQKHVLDEKVIDDEHSELAIKYLATSKVRWATSANDERSTEPLTVSFVSEQGHARKVLLDAAEASIKSIEDKLSDENRDELLNSSAYRRARELMQSMQD